MAEYYHIYDYRSVPCKLLGTLVSGLKADSRIGMIREGTKASPETIILVRIYDLLAQVFSAKGKEPQSLLQYYLIEEKPKSDYMTFRCGDDFKEKWSEINRRKDGE